MNNCIDLDLVQDECNGCTIKEVCVLIENEIPSLNNPKNLREFIKIVAEKIKQIEYKIENGL